MSCYILSESDLNLIPHTFWVLKEKIYILRKESLHRKIVSINLICCAIQKLTASLDFRLI